MQEAIEKVTLDEVWRLFKETDRKWRETDERFKAMSQETYRQWKETDERFKAMSQEADKRFQETDRQLKELGKQIGGIGDKFGYFAEGMALPSMEKILTERFGMEVVSPRVRIRKAGREMENDVIAWANGDVNTVIVVEVKSRVKQEAVNQLQRIIEEFDFFYPEHKGKKKIGILAGVDWDKDVDKSAQEAGFYTASIHDDLFDLTTPEGFEAKAW